MTLPLMQLDAPLSPLWRITNAPMAQSKYQVYYVRLPDSMRLRLWNNIYETNSKTSGAIKVLEKGPERILLIGNGKQSIFRSDGKYHDYWTGLTPELQHLESSLILGLGGGTIATILRKRWPEVRIDAYEIDPEVVRVAIS